MQRDRTLLTLVIALLTGCRTAAVPTVDAALAARARLIRIEDTRRVDSAFLDSALRAPDPSVRRVAAFSAVRVGARALMPTLRALTSDPDARVAAAALYALGLMKDTGAVALATTALRGAPDVAREGAWLLGVWVSRAGRL
jgi:HEAT repeat protein